MRRWSFAYYDSGSVFRSFSIVAKTKQEAVSEAFLEVGRKQKEAVLVWCCLEM